MLRIKSKGGEISLRKIFLSLCFLSLFASAKAVTAGGLPPGDLACSEALSRHFSDEQRVRDTIQRKIQEYEEHKKLGRLEEKLSYYQWAVGTNKSATEERMDLLSSDIHESLKTHDVSQGANLLRVLFRNMEMAALGIRHEVTLASALLKDFPAAQMIAELPFYSRWKFLWRGSQREQESQYRIREYLKIIGQNYSVYRRARLLLEKVAANEAGKYSGGYSQTAQFILSRIHGQGEKTYPEFVGTEDPPEMDEIDEYFYNPISIEAKLKADLKAERRRALTALFVKTADYIKYVRPLKALAKIRSWELIKQSFEEMILTIKYRKVILNLRLMNTDMETKVYELREYLANSNTQGLLDVFPRIPEEEVFWQSLKEEVIRLAGDSSQDKTLQQQKFERLLTQMKEAEAKALEKSDLSLNRGMSPIDKLSIFLQSLALGTVWYLNGPFGEADSKLWELTDQAIQGLVAKGAPIAQATVEVFQQASLSSVIQEVMKGIF